MLVHVYFSLEDETIWDVIQTKIPLLKATIEQIIIEENLS
ncbi:HepT-like ribonuclease domain-containing protein [Geminocystis sp. CENA526]